MFSFAKKRKTMKRNLLTLTFITLICTLFMGCAGDDEKHYLGSWKLVNVSKITYPNYPSRNSLVSESVYLNECQEKERIVFTDRTFTSYSYELQSDGTCLESVVEVPYTYVDEILTFSIDGKTHRFEMTSGGGGLKLLSDIGNNQHLQKLYDKL